MAEILATELRADPEALRHLVDLGFEFEVTEGATCVVTCCRQVVEVTSRSEFDCLEVRLSRCATDNKGKVVWRTSRCAEIGETLGDEVEH